MTAVCHRDPSSSLDHDAHPGILHSGQHHNAHIISTDELVVEASEPMLMTLEGSTVAEHDCDGVDDGSHCDHAAASHGQSSHATS